MNSPFVSLRPEITRADALTLIDWLEDESVTRYLSDSRDVSRSIERLIGRVQLPILTHLFNQGGRFFMVCDRHDAPVGFVRLILNGTTCEMVVLIGERENWGRRLGARAVREGMKLAFLDMRADKLVAKIHPGNVRSLKAFERCGFTLESDALPLNSYAITAGRYRRFLRENPAAQDDAIRITELDKVRLAELLATGPAGAFELEHEVERAIVVDPLEVPPDVVTMNSRALLELDDDALEVSLVYPQDADDRAGRLSIVSDVGTAILGYREGDAFDWRVADRTRRVRIAKVLYQPEAAGHLHL